MITKIKHLISGNIRAHKKKEPTQINDGELQQLLKITHFLEVFENFLR